MLVSTPAQAVPSFARQTGLACEACHTILVNNNQNPFFLNKWPNPKASDNNTFVLGLWMDF